MRTNRNRPEPPRAEAELTRVLTRSTLAFVLLGLMLAAIGSGDAASARLEGKVLVESLRAGGYNIYFRHVATDWSQSDDLQQADDWQSCDPARMRQLSAAGRRDAAAIGDAIRALEIPVESILASPYCRTMETARLMRLGEVTASVDVMNLRAARFFGGRAAIVETARRLLGSDPPAGANRVIVAHGNVARESTPAYPDEGEGLVFKPNAAGGFDLVARIKPRDWQKLLRLTVVSE